MADPLAPPPHIPQDEFDICSDVEEINRWVEWQRRLDAYPTQAGMPTRIRIFPLPRNPAENVYDPTLPENRVAEEDPILPPPQPPQPAGPPQGGQPPPGAPPQPGAQPQPGAPPPAPAPQQPPPGGPAPAPGAPQPQPPAAMLGGAALPNVLPVLFDVPHVDETKVTPLVADFRKKFGIFSGFSHPDPEGHFRSADQYFKERNIKALEAARIFVDNTDSDALLWISQIQQMVPGECEEEDVQRYRNARYWTSQEYFPGRKPMLFSPLTWGAHPVSLASRRDSTESLEAVDPQDAIPGVVLGQMIPDPQPNDPDHQRAAEEADVREPVPAHSGRPYMKGRHGWSRVQPRKPSNFQFRQDLPRLRPEPFVEPTHNLLQYLRQRYTKKADPDLADKYLKAVQKQPANLQTTVHLTLFKKVWLQYWRTKYNENERIELGNFGTFYQKQRLEHVLKSLNPAFKTHLEHAKAANPVLNTITSFSQLEQLAQAWEQDVQGGVAFVKSCVPFVPHRVPFQGAKISALTVEQLFNIDEPDGGTTDSKSQGGGETANASSASTNSILHGRGRGRGRGRGGHQTPGSGGGNSSAAPKPKVLPAVTNPKAPDGFFEYHNVQGVPQRNAAGQYLCNFCGIPSHPRSHCSLLQQFRAEGNNCQVHPQKGQLQSGNAQRSQERRGRGRGRARGRGRGRGGQAPSAPQTHNASAATTPYGAQYAPIQAQYPLGQDPRGTWVYPTQGYQQPQAFPSLQNVVYQHQMANAQAAAAPNAMVPYDPAAAAQYASGHMSAGGQQAESQDQSSQHFTCPYCHKKFPTIGAFYRHAEVAHPQQWSSQGGGQGGTAGQ